jgi:hypothetical protein
MADLVTITSNPDLHARLLKAASAEARMGHLPGYVIVGNITYKIMQDSNHETAFLPQSDQANYESTSFVK